MKKKSGRKKVADKKEQIPLFVRKSIVIANGGKEVMRDKIYNFIGQVA